MIRSHFIIAVSLLLLGPLAQGQVYLPNHKSEAQKLKDLNDYYQHWKRQYLKPSNGNTPGGGYYVEMFGPGKVGSEGHKSTSEAMGYGLLITVLSHRLDPQAQALFDGLYNMVSRHSSINSRYLMSWVIHQTERTSRSSTSATDGDFDIALALILADRIWGSSGRINYKRQAQLLVDEILRKTINRQNNKIMLGDWWNASWSEISRPSDWMGGHLVEFYRLTGNQRFVTTRNKLYSMARQIQSTHSPQTGLLPDFIESRQNRPARPHTLEGPHDGAYYYNAARVPLRMIIDYRKSQDPVIAEVVAKMAEFIHRQSQGRPAQIRSGYTLSGKLIGNYFDATFAAPMIAACTVDRRYQSFVNQGWDFLIRQRMNYYADSLNMLSLLYLSGQWL